MPRASKSSQDPQKNPSDFTFFWTTNHVNGWASQWYPASFTARVKINSKEEGEGECEDINFPTTEHWMMLHKALLFNDIPIARKIIASTSTTKKDMKAVKSLGRKVSNFDDETWKAHRRRIVLKGTLHKFRQNEDLKRKLLDTGDTEIAEAAPRDRIWGIGFGEKNALGKYAKWGMNLLGKALVEARGILREEECALAGKESEGS
ncbi:hypothetical protein H0H92_002527 [Tricholoma furcatifolium]|nr:hypothetical protein H0H92_002527 [Tricholoma furcatifolium]